MSEESVNTQLFYIERAKGGRAACKVCKNKCLNGELRFAKLVPSPYGDNQQMKSWHHVDCMMTALLKQRPTTKRIDSIDDIGNWHTLSKEDQEFVLEKINQMEKEYEEKYSGKYKAKLLKNECAPVQKMVPTTKDIPTQKVSDKNSEDDKFSEFIGLCKKISSVDAYTDKTSIVNKFFQKGTDGEKFTGDLTLWCKLLLPQVTKRVYNLKSKQLVKLFSRIFSVDQDTMLEHLEKGDVADTIKHYYSKSKHPAKSSTLTIQEVDDFLEELSKLTKEDQQIYHFKKIINKCTSKDLKMIIRIIKGDLRINAGPKHILEGVHPDAYKVLQTSRDLDMVIQRVSQSSGVKPKDAIQKTVQAKIALMTPVLPMLAEACKSVEMAMKKCPNGMFSEIKYDGERVQVHKKDREFMYFSRSLKPVMPHKVSHFKDYLPKAFPEGEDLILDAEVLMIDNNTGKPLPFGTLGKHKHSEFKDASVCLFVFDCLYYNGQVLLDVPIKNRRQILLEHMKEVKNHIMFSEQEIIRKPADLANMIAKVLQLGLEGLVLKDLHSTYEPGKRHWLKVKKDYLFDGAMADSADLVVLGAWFGTGKKGGMMSVFLMGCYDTTREKWVTVTKVHTGHDDSTLERLQKELEPLMLKISQDNTRIPNWLDCNKGLIPDFVAKDPKKQPVWEITGTEFTKANIHTAEGISVRFPRVTRIRKDKNWKTATNLKELKHLYVTSKENTDVTLLNKLAETASKDDMKNKKDSPNSSKDMTLDEDDVKSEKSKSSEKRKRKIDIEEVDEKPNSSKNNSNSDLDDIKSEKSKSSEKSKRKIDVDEKPNSSKNNSNNDLYDDKSEKSKSSEKKKRKLDKDKNPDSSIGKANYSSEENDVKSEKNRNEERKRKKGQDEVDSKPSPKKLKGDTKTIDQFFKKDRTSLKSPNSSEVNYKLLPDNPLPDVFKDLKLGFYPDYISFTEDERIHFERHWVAFGGKVVKAIRPTDLDYVIHNNDKILFKESQKMRRTLGSSVKIVNKKWLYKCIEKRELCDITDFPVYIDPN